MGIDTSAMLMVGLKRGEMRHSDELQDMIDGGCGLECCPTFYDGGGYDSEVIGICIAESGYYCAAEIELNIEEIEKAKSRFKTLTGQDAKVYIAPHIW